MLQTLGSIYHHWQTNLPEIETYIPLGMTDTMRENLNLDFTRADALFFSTFGFGGIAIGVIAATIFKRIETSTCFTTCIVIINLLVVTTLKGLNAHPYWSTVAQKGLNLEHIKHFKFTLISSVLLDVITVICLRKFKLIETLGTVIISAALLLNQLTFANFEITKWFDDKIIETIDNLNLNNYYQTAKKCYVMAYECLVGAAQSLLFPVILGGISSIDYRLTFMGTLGGFFQARTLTAFTATEYPSPEEAEKSKNKYAFITSTAVALINLGLYNYIEKRSILFNVQMVGMSIFSLYPLFGKVFFK